MAGDWYLTAPCECGDWIVIEHSQGPTRVAYFSDVRRLTCDACGKSAGYQFKDLRHARTNTGPNDESPPPLP
jgi:hypothetical protein